jgi:hypothetical protein
MEKLRTTRIMMATVRYVAPGVGHTKSQAAWFFVSQSVRTSPGPSVSCLYEFLGFPSSFFPFRFTHQNLWTLLICPTRVTFPTRLIILDSTPIILFHEKHKL